MLVPCDRGLTSRAGTGACARSTARGKMTGMASEYEEDNQHLKAAIDHAVAGDLQAAVDALRPIWTKSPEYMFSLWQALAETAISPIRHQPPGGPRYGLQVFAPYEGIDIDNLPPHVRLALRFIAAQAYHDDANLRALFGAPLMNRDSLTLAETMALLLQAAAESVRAQQAQAHGGAQREARGGVQEMPGNGRQSR